MIVFAKWPGLRPDYLVEADAVRVLRAAGRRVYIHIPISAGEMLDDTLPGFKTLAASATERTLVV